LIALKAVRGGRKKKQVKVIEEGGGAGGEKENANGYVRVTKV